MTRLVVGALFLAIVVLSFFAGRVAALGPGVAVIPFAKVGAFGFGETDPATPTGAPYVVGVALAAGSTVLHSPTLAQKRASASLSMSGTASWGCCWTGVVTRLPRGTHICVTGPLGRWCGKSVGYGPAKRTERIADLSAVVFRDICGRLSMGLCRVVLTW